MYATLDGRALDLSVTATDTAGRVVGWRSYAMSTAWGLAYDQAGRPYLQQNVAPSSGGVSTGVGAQSLPPEGDLGAPPYLYSPTTGKKIRDDFNFAYGRSEDTTYTYGHTNRLTSATRNGAATTYAYDTASGALESYKVSTESSVTFAYGSKGRIESAGDMRYSHDSLGRRNWQGPSAEPSQTAFTWQGERLTAQSGAGWSANHVYDATGQRVRSVVTSGSVETTITWAYEGIRLTGLEGVRSDEATWALEYLYDEKGTVTGGIYSAEGTSTAFLVVATDRGDVRELLDADGHAFAFYSYDAYGNPGEKLSRATTQIPAALAAQIAERNVLRYAGYCYDEMSGLYYLSQRYYDPATACFISKDPARADGEESAYQYCAGDPVGSVDPSGEWARLVERSTGPWTLFAHASYFYHPGFPSAHSAILLKWRARVQYRYGDCRGRNLFVTVRVYWTTGVGTSAWRFHMRVRASHFRTREKSSALGCRRKGSMRFDLGPLRGRGAFGPWLSGVNLRGWVTHGYGKVRGNWRDPERRVRNPIGKSWYFSHV
ncbi:MAG: hypothetical protein CVT60_06145 [Actinobacteria bacterium HGW-Actinobacteria-10]|nr:MAG: hypothetical protein CVT60_06145 [Actinobacteria bacterium HGW-Actinobacteria-10]